MKLRGPLSGVVLLVAALLSPAGAGAQTSDPGEVLAAIVGVHSEVAEDARTAHTLGRERWGSGVVIDNGGLVLTIGYLVLEATSVEVFAQNGTTLPAQVVAYDHQTGFGLVRTFGDLGVPAVPLGDSRSVRPGDPVLAIAFARGLEAKQLEVADRREFAGYWEYLLEDAIFTTPLFASHSGAALLSSEGKVLAIGSLAVGDSVGAGIASPGNMFVPVQTLQPVLGELVATGHREEPPRPWLGIYAVERGGSVQVSGVAKASPAERAGIRPGDIVVGIHGEPVGSLAELWSKLWRSGSAGASVDLDLLTIGASKSVVVDTIDRRQWLRWGPGF